ncbi:MULTISPECIES: hypothetical protein [Photorhabdus]|uniref:Uncharacterized protein n=1 Tax=Photorhabdus bodei TaxID=2029681 RepID=A0AAW6BGY3_9GAMM|nr:MULTISPECIES: hypothetical protein [Photorhabdus]MDB6367415.1 hypothetical protein [Photorhabdus bodei]MDB6371109.1 hypothetical protein [Photorhabdus bodei]
MSTLDDHYNGHLIVQGKGIGGRLEMLGINIPLGTMDNVVHENID